MSDNRKYWSDLLGDDFDEDLFNSVLNSPPGGKAETPQGDASANAGPQTGKAGEDHFTQAKPISSAPEPDTSRFVSFDLSAVKKIPELQIKKESEDLSLDNSDTGREDFDVDFDFDGEYRDAPESGPLHVRRQRRTGCVGGILYAAFIVCVSLILAALLWIAATDVLGLNKSDSDVSITVPDNYTIQKVSDILYDSGVIKYKSLFRIYCRYTSADEKIKAGTYTINMNYDYRAIVTGLTPGTGDLVETDVTIPEGYNLIQIFDLLEEKKVCSADKLWDAATNYDFDYDFLDSSTLGDAYRLEGYMFPDTYTFYEDDTATRVIKKFLNNFEEKFTEEYSARAAELGYTVREIVTIASMIEKEAAYDSERDAIASVIYNRLDSSSFPNLQIDAAIYYGIAINGGTVDDFSTDYDSPYNTYICEGLPPGPIANPGAASLRAALYPQDTSYYYYALSTDGGHEFFSSFSAFTNFINSDKFAG